MRAILTFLGIGRAKRFRKMANKVRFQNRRLYACAADCFPAEYLSMAKCGEGAGRVRYFRWRMTFGKPLPPLKSKRSEMRTMRDYRKDFPKVSLKDRK